MAGSGLRDFSELLGRIVQLSVVVPVVVDRVEPFITNNEQHYKVTFPCDLEPSGESSVVLSNSEILFYMATKNRY